MFPLKNQFREKLQKEIFLIFSIFYNKNVCNREKWMMKENTGGDMHSYLIAVVFIKFYAEQTLFCIEMHNITPEGQIWTAKA
jgi:hypothetical protein